ncbi:hypothetical protein F4806DRAFT_492160 [Annulohypoxylon nitens]|nr:hypothetical protein F4806DRAFT_492160 [Annulohypoxylon nitens]
MSHFLRLLTARTVSRSSQRPYHSLRWLSKNCHSISLKADKACELNLTAHSGSRFIATVDGREALITVDENGSVSLNGRGAQNVTSYTQPNGGLFVGWCDGSTQIDTTQLLTKNQKIYLIFGGVCFVIGGTCGMSIERRRGERGDEGK